VKQNTAGLSCSLSDHRSHSVTGERPHGQCDPSRDLLGRSCCLSSMDTHPRAAWLRRRPPFYLIELAAAENTLLAFEPVSRIDEDVGTDFDEIHGSKS
jgi:hypothetical protein